MSRLATLLAALAALVSLCRPAAAEPATQIIVPLTIDYLTLGAALKRQVYDAPGGRAILWKGTNDCEFLNAYNPRFSLGAAAVELDSDGELGLGVPLTENCVGPLSWKGIIAVDAAPYLAPDLTLMFRVTDINLYDRQHQKSLIVGRGFDLIKQNFIPRLRTFKFDLRAPIEEFRALASEAAPAGQAASFKQALATVHSVGPAIAERNGIRVTLALTVPVQPASQPTVASGPLTPAELAAWDEQLDQWDAFIVFAIKQIGSTIADSRSAPACSICCSTGAIAWLRRLASRRRRADPTRSACSSLTNGGSSATSCERRRRAASWATARWSYCRSSRPATR